MSRAPAPTKPAPAGAMSAPRLQQITLAAAGSQIFTAAGWRTVRRIAACHWTVLHGSTCSAVTFSGAVTHFDLSAEVWIRHPVGGGRS
jgi:hypothetical protein